MELWQRRLKGLNTSTIEISLLGKRVLFTDDPENIKAILASQFGDYGMGLATSYCVIKHCMPLLSEVVLRAVPSGKTLHSRADIINFIDVSRA